MVICYSSHKKLIQGFNVMYLSPSGCYPLTWHHIEGPSLFPATDSLDVDNRSAWIREAHAAAPACSLHSAISATSFRGHGAIVNPLGS